MMRRHATYESNSGSTNRRIGYLDGRTLIAHNTFVFARWNNEATNGGWESESRASTVGIIDVTAPACTLIGDPDPRPRGVGNPCIVSNVFRTRPVSGTPSVRPFAMLGVGDEDTRAYSSATSSYVQTNAFDPARVGTTNGTFWSLPVTSFVVSVPQAIATHWNCQITLFNGSCTGASSVCTVSAPPQSPAQHVWDGTNGVDPAFVGEFVSTCALRPHKTM
ncbi:MAG: hypothetical protein IPK60_20480 [Sandaracinaceae bacterium]|nr:hypothetical protein [Sandaracinaceae bacterium]